MIKAERRQRAVPRSHARGTSVIALTKMTATSHIKDKGKRIKDETAKQLSDMARI
jgi:hypothetical protein